MATKRNPVQELEAAAEQKAKEMAAAQDIPDSIARVLKLYPQHKELYVDPFGAVFVPGSPVPLGSKAALYANPYFN